MENKELLQAIRTMIHEEIKPINKRLDSMEKDMTTIKFDINTINSDMTTIKSDINTINSDMTAIKSDINTINSDMTTIKSDINTINSDMTTAKFDINTIRSTMATKADIIRLENKIEQYGEVQQKDIYHLLQLTSKKVDAIHEDVKSLAEVTGEHEMKIRSLSRRPV